MSGSSLGSEPIPAQLIPHFERIRQQPETVRPLLLSRLSCTLRLPLTELSAQFARFCLPSPP